MLLLSQELSHNHLQFVSETIAVRVVGDGAEELGTLLALAILGILEWQRHIRQIWRVQQRQLLGCMSQLLLRNPSVRRRILITGVTVSRCVLILNLLHCCIDRLTVLHLLCSGLIGLIDYTRITLEIVIFIEIIAEISFTMSKLILLIRHRVVIIIAGLSCQPPRRFLLTTIAHLIQSHRRSCAQMLMPHCFNETTAYSSSTSISLQQRHHLAFASAFTKLHKSLLPSILHHSDACLKETECRRLLRTRCSIRDLPCQTVVVRDPFELTLQLLDVCSASLLHCVPRGNQLAESHRCFELLKLPILFSAQCLLQFVRLCVEVHAIGPVRTLESCLLLLALKHPQHELVLILNDHTIDDLENTNQNLVDLGFLTQLPVRSSATLALHRGHRSCSYVAFFARGQNGQKRSHRSALHWQRRHGIQQLLGHLADLQNTDCFGNGHRAV
mmetsp:Transcript_50510/g.114745  ORF Transcript_50510/g.114745 Transcript_50510/m.114745 type:complete len:443 (-) Transcript_50510:273-1601(-)